MDELDASLLQELLTVSSTNEQKQHPENSLRHELPTNQVTKTTRSVMTQTGGRNEAKPSVPKHIPEYGPHQKFTRRYEESQYPVELGIIKGTKVICSLDLLVQQLGGMCKHIPAAAAILLSGYNFAKIERFAQFLGLSFISPSTFFRVQKLYCIPAIDEWWQWMRAELIDEFQNKELVVSGDGQCDSPGFSAKNLCYYLMEIVSEYILEVEVLDKRHVGMKSSTMETRALKNALERLKSIANVIEVCTDASSSIKKLVGKYFQFFFLANVQGT